MQVLLLGKSGFVGQNLFERLSVAGGFEFAAPGRSELDVMDERSVFERLRNGSYDVVLNCLDAHGAADAGYAEARLRMYHNLANHADLFGKMIYFGSGAEYGRQLPVANVREEDFGRVVPGDSYGFALYQMSLHAMASENIYNLRLFGIFGPHEIWQRRFISNIICRGLLGAPLVMRQDRLMDYLYTADLAKMVHWMMTSEPAHHDYNATSGRAISLYDLAKEIMRQLGIEDEELYCAWEGMGAEYTSSNGRISREMGGFSAISIRESIADLIRYYRSNIGMIDYSELLLS